MSSGLPATWRARAQLLRPFSPAATEAFLLAADELEQADIAASPPAPEATGDVPGLNGFGATTGRTGPKPSSGAATAPATHTSIIPDVAAAQHLGQRVTVEGTVFQVVPGPSASFLNLGAKYPDQPFQVVVYYCDEPRFPDLEQWEGKQIRVTGKVREYNGRPQIVLKDPAQIRAAP